MEREIIDAYIEIYVYTQQFLSVLLSVYSTDISFTVQTPFLERYVFLRFVKNSLSIDLVVGFF